MQKVKYLQGFLGILPDERPVILSKFAAPQKFGVDFRQLRQLALKFQMRGDTGAGAFALFGRFEQKLSYPAGAQALDQIIKGAVLESPAATAIVLATRQELPDV